MACTAENCQRECAERSQEGYDFRTFSQNLFSDLKHAVQAAGSLQRRACCHHGDDGQNNVDRRFTRRKTYPRFRTEHNHNQADAGEQTQEHTAARSGDEEECNQQGKLEPEINTHGEFLLSKLSEIFLQIVSI